MYPPKLLMISDINFRENDEVRDFGVHCFQANPCMIICKVTQYVYNDIINDNYIYMINNINNINNNDNNNNN